MCTPRDGEGAFPREWLVPGLLFLSGCGLLEDDSLRQPTWGTSNRQMGNDNMPTLRRGTSLYDFEFSVEVPDDSVTVFSVRGTRGEEASNCSEPFTYTEDSTSGASMRPRVAVNAAGSAAVVWARDNGTGNPGNLVYANTFE